MFIQYQWRLCGIKHYAILSRGIGASVRGCMVRPGATQALKRMPTPDPLTPYPTFQAFELIP